ncbi:uncharacterized protein LOC110819092 [Carica papaya]|uniref:uncharacterized protein LOC110819092 n=1 Tax=Carica papaya TaxID=3649 RepID=UPI000B8CB9A3|nr:uncharacterized protein LOC110819092 [Carica papaya]
MAASLSRTQPTCHTRSNSLPSRPHPLRSEAGEYLKRLRSYKATSTSSSSIGQKLNDLQDLHDGVAKLLQLPLTQQAFTRVQNKAPVDELLDGSLRLLDLCSSGKNALLQTKESVHELQSAIRRKRGGEIADEIRKFIASRKTVKMTIQKILKSLKDFENNYMFDKDEESFATLLSEVAPVTIAILESLLLFICGSKAQSKQKNNWFVLSKLMQTRKVASEEEADVNEFSMVDAALHSLLCCRSNKTVTIESAQSKLQNLELCIQDLEGELERLFRCLIRTRVSILNMLNN